MDVENRGQLDLSIHAVRTAAFYGDLTRIKALHLQGAPLQSNDPKYRTTNPLDIAVLKYNLPVVSYLLEHGCKNAYVILSALKCSSQSEQRIAMLDKLWASGVRPNDNCGGDHLDILWAACDLGDPQLITRLFELGVECPEILGFSGYRLIAGQDVGGIFRALRQIKPATNAYVNTRITGTMDLATKQVMEFLSFSELLTSSAEYRTSKTTTNSFIHLFDTGLINQIPEHYCKQLNFLQSWTIYRAEHPKQSSILARLRKSGNLLQMWWEDDSGTGPIVARGDDWNFDLDYSGDKVSKREKRRQFTKFCKMFAAEHQPAVKRTKLPASSASCACLYGSGDGWQITPHQKSKMSVDKSDVSNTSFDFIDRLFSIYLLATWEHERTTPQLPQLPLGTANISSSVESSTSSAVAVSPLLNRQVGFSKMEWMLKTYHHTLTIFLNLALPVIGPPRLVTEFLYFIPQIQNE